MAKVQHICTGCVPIDATIIEVYTQLISTQAQAQEAAERAEYAAEHAIGKSPYIGENGDWWEWNDEQGVFIDTGVQAQGSIAVDYELSTTSTNPVQNRVITQALNQKYVKPAAGIPASDIASGVIPDVSQFITASVNNLVNYYLKSETYNKTEVDSLIAAVSQFSYEVVASLPTASASTMYKIYLVPSAEPKAQNVKDEYITIRSGSEGSYTYAWEQIGSTAIDLSGYVTTEQLNTALSAYTTTANLTTLLAAKQDVISDLATIRSGAAAGATAYQKPGSGIPKTDLESGVQASLELADSAIQARPMGEIDPTITPADYATKEELYELEAKVDGIESNYVSDEAYDSTGAANGAEGWFRSTDYVPVQNGDTIVWNPGENGGTAHSLILYNSSKERIDYWSSNAVERTFTLNNASSAYIRASFAESNKGYAKLIVNNVIVWQPIDASVGLSERVTELGNSLSALSNSVSSVDEKTDALSASELVKNKAQVYNPGSYYPIIKSDGSSIYYKSSGLTGRGSLNFNITGMSTLASVMGVSLVDLSPTDKYYIKIEDSYCMIIDGQTKNPAIKHRNDITKDDIVLIASVSGKIVALNTESFGIEWLTKQIDGLSQRVDLTDESVQELSEQIGGVTPMQTKGGDFAVLFNGATGTVEPFLFFSDPHWFQNYNSAELENGASDKIELIKKYFDSTPTNFVLCGGDWLTNHKQSVAIKDLAYIDGLMNKMFPDKYFPVFGNHDNNYQGELDETEGTSANDGVISDQTMINLWFRKFGKMYYTFKGTATRFYVFDTGLDNNRTTMSPYRWEQVAWLGEHLQNNEDEHIVLAMHIVSNSGDSFGNIASLADNISLLAESFNARTSITLNGVTYDFSNATGRVHCILCGHTHYDYTGTLNNIPVFCITTARNGAFDLVLLDYGAGKLKSVRVGSGIDREMTLA